MTEVESNFDTTKILYKSTNLISWPLFTDGLMRSYGTQLAEQGSQGLNLWNFQRDSKFKFHFETAYQFCNGGEAFSLPFYTHKNQKQL